MSGNMLELTEFSNGLKVRELKIILKDWPEEDPYGEPTEVWIGNTKDGFSNQVSEVSTLNLCRCGSREWADLILSHD